MSELLGAKWEAEIVIGLRKVPASESERFASVRRGVWPLRSGQVGRSEKRQGRRIKRQPANQSSAEVAR